MTQAQSHQELTDIKILLMKCFIAESDLACFLLEKASSTELTLDETFRLKQLTNRVEAIIHEIKASDASPPPDKLPVYLWRGATRWVA
jgi:hypothetical protein